MTDVEALLASIAGAPAGPSTTAFFDLDGTVIEGFTAEGRLPGPAASPRRRAWRARPLDPRGPGHAVPGRDPRQARQRRVRGASRSDGRRAGRARRTAVPAQHRQPDLPAGPQLVEAHRKAGHRLVLATSATPFQAEPVGADLGFDAVLCTRPKVQAGMLMGELDGDVL